MIFNRFSIDIVEQMPFMEKIKLNPDKNGKNDNRHTQNEKKVKLYVCIILWILVHFLDTNKLFCRLNGRLDHFKADVVHKIKSDVPVNYNLWVYSHT